MRRASSGFRCIAARIRGDMHNRALREGNRRSPPSQAAYTKKHGRTPCFFIGMDVPETPQALLRLRLCFDDLNGTAVIGTALRAHSVALAQRAALRARSQNRSRQLPVGAAPLIAPCAGNFPFRDCHDDTSLIDHGDASRVIYKSFCNAAQRGSISFWHRHVSTFRFAPQPGHTPLQSSRQSSFVSILRI